MSTTLRAAVRVGPGRFEVRKVPRPEVRAGQVRLRLEGSGVCGSNLPPWEGRPGFRSPLHPGQPGHEGWGVVEAVGAGVTDVSEGDRVAVISGAAFAEYESVDAGSVVTLPAALAGQPFPGEPLGCVANVWRRSDIRAGQVVAIVGVGFLGAVLTRLAVTEGHACWRRRGVPPPGGSRARSARSGSTRSRTARRCWMPRARSPAGRCATAWWSAWGCKCRWISPVR